MPLNESQQARIRDIHTVLGDVLRVSLKDWMNGFWADLFPEISILRWEEILAVFKSETLMRKIGASSEAKRSLLEQIAGKEQILIVKTRGQNCGPGYRER